jgi:hypothetical protein
MNTHFLIKSDNQGVIHAMGVNLIALQRIPSCNKLHNLWISSLYIPSIDNLADIPSRGLPAPSHIFAKTTFTLPQPLHPFLVWTLVDN